MTDLGGGRVHLYSGRIGDVQGGIGTIIAVMSKKRSATLPDVPSVAEAGFPEAEAPQWWGVFAPVGTPKEVVDKLDNDIIAVMGSPDSVEFLKRQGAEPSTMSADEFANHVKNEIEKWSALVRKRNISAN